MYVNSYDIYIYTYFSVYIRLIMIYINYAHIRSKHKGVYPLLSKKVCILYCFRVSIAFTF